jgi:hypothetical protein
MNFSLSSPLGLIVISLVVVVVFYFAVYGINISYLYTTAPPFLEQSATYEFRNKVKQPFYQQDQ